MVASTTLIAGQLNIVENEGKERLWHRRYGHLNESSLQKLVNKELTIQVDYNTKSKIGFCETCIDGKHHHTHFEASSSKSNKPLKLVYSDVYRKMNTKSLGGAKYYR